MLPSTKKSVALPFSPIASPRAAWMAAAVGVKGIQTLESIFLAQGGGDRFSAIGWGVIEIACAYVATRFAMRAPRRRDAVIYVAAGAMASVVIGAIRLSGRGLAPLKAGAQEYPVATWLLVALALSIVLPLIALWNALLANVLHPLMQSSSHENSDRALAAAALWVAVPHSAAGILCLSRFGAGTPLWIKAIDLVVLVALPAVLALLGVARIRQRRRWLRLVEGGQQSGWRLVDSDMPARVQLPVVAGAQGQPEKVLVRVLDGHEPFRSAQLEHVALVGGPPR